MGCKGREGRLWGPSERDEGEIMTVRCNLEPVHFKGRSFLSYFHNRTGYSDPPHCCVESKII